MARSLYGKMLWSGEHMPTITEWLLPEFDAEIASTRKVLAAVPEEKFDWRPHAKSFTMQQLAGHVAELLSWTGEVLRGDRFDVDAAKSAGERELQTCEQAADAGAIRRMDSAGARRSCDGDR